MKKWVFSFISFLLVFSLQAQSDSTTEASAAIETGADTATIKTGIEFTKGTWADILKEAKTKKKLVFLDAYTTWCGPCKMMSADVFTDDKVAKFYNARFINAKIDMEKGEGVDLATKYQVKAYPSLLFVDGDGNLVHRKAGYHGVEQFVELGRIALNPFIRLSGMDKRYQEGDRDPDFLHAYALVKYEAMDGTHGEIANEYLGTQKDWSTDENMRFIFNFVESVDSKLFDYLVDNRSTFEEKFGTPTVMSKLQNLMLSKAFTDHQDERLALKKMDELFVRVFKENAGQISSAFKMSYFQFKGDNDNFSKAAVNYFNKYPSTDAVELNNTAWAFYERVEDKQMLNYALDWALKSVKLDSQYYNNDTLAALYYKLGKRGKAKKAAKIAIGIAKANGDDYTSTKTLLGKMKKK